MGGRAPSPGIVPGIAGHSWGEAAACRVSSSAPWPAVERYSGAEILTKWVRRGHSSLTVGSISCGPSHMLLLVGC
jgi:hypothetical protein